MRRNVLKYSAILAVAVAACSEPTGINQGLAVPASPRLVATTTGGQLNILAGNNQIVQADNFTFNDPTVQVLDANGAAVQGASVVFATVSLTGVTQSAVGNAATCAEVTAFSSTVTTNASGQAAVRWCLKASGGQSMTATISDGTKVTFNGIATSNGTVPVINKIGGVDQPAGTMGGQVALMNPTVKVVDGAGVALPSVLLSWTPDGNGVVKCCDASTRTDATGVAAVSFQLSTTSPSKLTVTADGSTKGPPPVSVTPAVFSIPVKPAGTIMNVVAGASNTAVNTQNSVFGPKDPAVQILKTDGTSVGAGVAVKVTFGANSGICGAYDGDFYYTDSNGILAIRWCNKGTTGLGGSRTITFTAGTLTRTITGTISNDLTTMSVNQTVAVTPTGTVGLAASHDLNVTVTDANSKPVANHSVTFTANLGGTVAYNSPYATSKVVTTDAAGQAAVSWIFGGTPGTGVQTVVASVTESDGGTATATFTSGLVKVGAPVRIFIVAGDGLTGTKGTSSPKDPNVKVTDSFNNTITGTNNGSPTFTCTDNGGGGCVNVTFAVTAGGGSVNNAVVKTGETSHGGAGRAGTAWTLGATAGTNTLTATIPNGQFVTFTVVGQ